MVERNNLQSDEVWIAVEMISFGVGWKACSECGKSLLFKNLRQSKRVGTLGSARVFKVHTQMVRCFLLFGSGFAKPHNGSDG
jgi:hypothetical protein